MLGAILGDIIGSPYETPETAIKKTDFPLFTEKSHFTDDTVMTCAVCLGLMDSFGRDEETVHRTIASQMRALGRSYPGRGYGGHFQAWLLVDDAKAYGSYGNGSAMRVSAAGWLFRTLDDTLTAARLTAEVTHDHPEGIKGAQAIAAAIFLSRAHCDKADIRNYLMREFGYDLTRSVKEIRRTYQFDATCQGSVPEALICFLEGSGFVDVVRKAVSLGGDSDTLAAMAGSIAEAYYGVPENLEKEAYARLDSRLGAIVRQFHSFYRANSGRPLNGWQNEVYYDPDPELTGLGALEFAISDFYARSGSGKLNPNLVLDEVEKLMESNGNVLVPVQKPSRTLDKEKRNGGVEITCIADNEGRIMIPMFTGRDKLGSLENNYVMTTGLNELIDSLLSSENLFGIIIDPFGQNFVLDKNTVRFLQEKQKAVAESRARAEARNPEKPEQDDPASRLKKIAVSKKVDSAAARAAAEVEQPLAESEGAPAFDETYTGGEK